MYFIAVKIVVVLVNRKQRTTKNENLFLSVLIFNSPYDALIECLPTCIRLTAHALYHPLIINENSRRDTPVTVYYIIVRIHVPASEHRFCWARIAWWNIEPRNPKHCIDSMIKFNKKSVEVVVTEHNLEVVCVEMSSDLIWSFVCIIRNNDKRVNLVPCVLWIEHQFREVGNESRILGYPVIDVPGQISYISVDDCCIIIREPY